MNGILATDYPLKNRLPIAIEKTDLATQVDAVRFWPGMTWETYLDLPGCPAWIPLSEYSISKADILVYYTHSLMVDAIREQESMPKNNKPIGRTSTS